MKCQKGDVCMADDVVILAQFVKLGRLRKKVFIELAQKEISQICKLGEKKGKYCTSSTYHAVYDLIDKGLVEYVENNNFNLYEQVYISLSRTVSNFECISEELKQETITEALKKSQVINEYVKYQGKLLPFHMFVFEVKKNLLSKNLEG